MTRPRCGRRVHDASGRSWIAAPDPLRFAGEGTGFGGIFLRPPPHGGQRRTAAKPQRSELKLVGYGERKSA